MQCSACGVKIQERKMKPVTTFSGLNEQFYEKVEGFPTDQIEDLCVKCRLTIRNYNSDLNTQNSLNYGRDNTALYNNWHYSERTCYSEHLDQEVLKTENDYQGYRSLDGLEGTYIEY